MITPPLLSSTTPTQTASILRSYTPRKAKLRYKVNLLKNKILTKKQTDASEKRKRFQLQIFHSLCDKFLNKPLSDIVKLQSLLKNKESKGRRYSEEYKKFALTLYFFYSKKLQI